LSRACPALLDQPPLEDGVRLVESVGDEDTNAQAVLRFSVMPRRALLDSARHKLALARYHAESLRDILAQHPHDGPNEPLRVPLEAHLEGLAYTGTAAAEKTLRSLDPAGIMGEASIEQMVRMLKAPERPEEDQAFARDFEAWWMRPGERWRYAQVARDLRTDAAHDVYEKGRDGPRWRMRLERRPPIPLDDFLAGYLRELDELEALLARAEDLARAPARAG
jgi:hypothetical protein